MGKMWRLNWRDMPESGTVKFALYVALTVKLKRKYRLEWRFLSLMSGVKNIILVKPKKCDDNSASDYHYDYYYHCYDNDVDDDDDDDDDDADDDVESILHDFTFPRVPPGEETTQSLTHLIIILSHHHRCHHHHIVISKSAYQSFFE